MAFNLGYRTVHMCMQVLCVSRYTVYVYWHAYLHMSSTFWNNKVMHRSADVPASVSLSVCNVTVTVCECVRALFLLSLLSSSFPQCDVFLWL